MNQKYQKYYITVYPSLSDLTLQITVKGLTTPLSRWVQVGVCLCRYLVACCVVSYWIDTLVLKIEGNTYAPLLHHPFLFKGKTNTSSRGSKKDFWRCCRGGLRKSQHTKYPSHTLISRITLFSICLSFSSSPLLTRFLKRLASSTPSFVRLLRLLVFHHHV